jgi:hypothetical protein
VHARETVFSDFTTSLSYKPITGAENIRGSEKDEQPSTTDEGAEMTQQYSLEEEQQQQELPLVEDAMPILKESNRGAEEEATLEGRFHDSHEAGETFATHTATKDCGEALETLRGIFSVSENVVEDEKLKPPGNEYTVSFKQPDRETEDTSSQHPKSNPRSGFWEHDKHDEDETTEHPKSKPKITFREPGIGKKDNSTQHTK